MDLKDSEGEGESEVQRRKICVKDVVQCIFFIFLGVTLAITILKRDSLGLSRKHGCEDDYYKPHCRLHRGEDGYRNFLARAGLLLPPEIHKEISPSQLLSGRLLVVGDVHGCIEELELLLEKAEYVPGQDNLIFAGDLGDKGPHSIEVIDKIIRLGALSVRGNHDDTALGAYEAFQRGKTPKSKHHWAKHLTEAQARWLSLLPWTISIPAYNLIIVHAGLVPEVPLENQLLIDLYRMRELEPGVDTRWHGKEAKDDRGEGIPWAQVWSGPQHVVFGHDRQMGLQEEAYATGIDTACVYGKFLTGVLYPKVTDLLSNKGNGTSPSSDLLAPQIIQIRAKHKYA